jgi:hypothetical protein
VQFRKSRLARGGQRQSKHAGRHFRISLVVSLVLGLAGAVAPGSGGHLLSQQALAAQGTWQNVTPPVSLDPNNPSSNYGTDVVAVDPRTPSTVYVGTCYEGLWKSTDSGQSWVKVNTGSGGSLLDSGRLWALVVDPVNPQILYTTAGYGVGSVLKSTDGGVSWQDMFSGTPQAQQVGSHDIYGISIDPGNHNHLLAAFHGWWGSQQNTGLIESSDGGSSWTVRNPGGNWGAGNSVWFVSSQIWLVGTQGNGIWRTINSGGSWTQVDSDSISHGGINALTIDPSGRLYLGLWNKIVTSTDTGATWTDISSGLVYAGYQAIADDGTTLYTAPSGPDAGTNSQDTGVFTMPVGGSSWTRMSDPTCTGATCNGPAQAAYDPVHHLVYTANWLAGVWSLDLGPSPHPPRLVLDRRGRGSAQTGLFRVPTYWTLYWSYAEAGCRASHPFQLTVHASNGRVMEPRVQARGSCGHGSRSYRGGDVIYVRVVFRGRWRVRLWSTNVAH